MAEPILIKGLAPVMRLKYIQHAVIHGHQHCPRRLLSFSGSGHGFHVTATGSDTFCICKCMSVCRLDQPCQFCGHYEHPDATRAAATVSFGTPSLPEPTANLPRSSKRSRVLSIHPLPLPLPTGHQRLPLLVPAIALAGGALSTCVHIVRSIS